MSAKSIGRVLALAVLTAGLWAGEGRGQVGTSGLVQGSLHCLADGKAMASCPRDMEQCEREGHRLAVTEPFHASAAGWPGSSSYGPSPYFSVIADEETLAMLCARMDGHKVKATGIAYPATRSFWIFNPGQ